MEQRARGLDEACGKVVEDVQPDPSTGSQAITQEAAPMQAEELGRLVDHLDTLFGGPGVLFGGGGGSSIDSLLLHH